MPNCPLCNEPIGEGQSRCPACGVELDLEAPGMTIPPPGSLPPPARKSPSRPAPQPSSSRESPAIPEARPTAAEVPAGGPAAPAATPPPPVKPSKPRPKPRPAAVEPQDRPAPVTPQPGRVPPSAAPRAPYPPQAPPPYAPPLPPPYASGAYPPVADQGAAEDVGGLRGWLIKKLGGQAPAPEQPAPQGPGYGPAVPPGYGPYPYGPQASPPPGSGPFPSYAYPPVPGSPPGFSPNTPSEGPYGPPPTGAPSFGQVSTPEDESDGKTELYRGPDVRQLKFPTADYRLQLLDANGQWNNWCEIPAGGRNIGRSQNSANFPFLSSMAVRHLKLSYDGPRLKAEDLGSLNGTYVRITGPVELQDGMRFRVGSQVIEFHTREPVEPAPSERGPDGEEFISHDLAPLAALALIRPDNRPGIWFPILKSGITRIGSDENRADLTLTRAEWVSRQHAQIRHEGGHFTLEDTNSRNGTFVQIRGVTYLNPGDVLIVGRVMLRVVDSSSGM